MNKTLEKLTRQELIIAAALSLALVFGLLLLTGTITSGFHFTDDHQIIDLNSRLAGNNFLKVSIDWIKEGIEGIGRFYPVYFIHRVIEVKLFGTDMTVWAVYTGLLIGLSFFFFYTFMRKSGFSHFEAFLFPGLALVGMQSEIWWRFGTGETIGMLFLSLTLLFMALSARRGARSPLFTYIFVLFAVLTSLSKENFILLIPALLFWKVWLRKDGDKAGWIDAVKNELPSLLILSSVCAAEIFFIKTYVGTAEIGYAGYEGFNPGQFLVNFVVFSLLGHCWVIFAGFILLAALSLMLNDRDRYSQLLQWVIACLILFVVIVMPQVLIYAKSGVLAGRYILPGLLGYSFVMVYLLRLIREGTSGDGAIVRVTGLWKNPVLAVSWLFVLFLLVMEFRLMNNKTFDLVFINRVLAYNVEVEGIAAAPVLKLVSGLHALIRGLSDPKILVPLSLTVLLSYRFRGRFSGRVFCLRSILAAMISLVIVFNMLFSFEKGYFFAFEGRMTNDWLGSIERNTAPSDRILVVADPAVNYEWAQSLQKYLRFVVNRNDLYVYPILTKKGYASFERDLIMSFGSVHGKNSFQDIQDTDTIRAVLLFPETEDKFLKKSRDWFARQEFKRYRNEYGFVSYYRR